MPTYIYRCKKCKKEFEAIHSVKIQPFTVCACGGKLFRVITSGNYILKGKGFYKTDNREGEEEE